MLRITTLGRLAIERDSEPVTNLASRKTEALLVHVACAHRPQPREVLASRRVKVNQDSFEFLEVGDLVDGDLSLVLVERFPGNPEENVVPQYSFEMRVQNVEKGIGYITLRIGDSEYLRKYTGHIGYGVDEEYRGRRYAARGCKLVFPLAKRYGMNHVWITCGPENVASRRTCEIAGGVFEGTANVPEDHPAYSRGEFVKCRYRFDL